MGARNPHIGASTVREWSHALAPGSSILDVGCGHGIPISQVLIEEGFASYGVDASAKMVESFRSRFPNAHAECSAVEDSEFSARTFDGVVAWGLMFLLPSDAQSLLIRRVRGLLKTGGKFLFTSPKRRLFGKMH
jgi:2-polyprenyl-3-methyl-5-hydroxy-6-metoxy-1,4-benzoquinol methylase